jgi:LysM repeat protein
MDAQKRNTFGGADNGSDVLPPADTVAFASRGMCMLAIGIGVLGVITGVSGIMVANSASTEAAEAKQKAEAFSSAIDNINAKLTEFDERIQAVGAETMRANNSVTELRTQVTDALQKLQAQIRTRGAAKPAVNAAAGTATAPKAGTDNDATNAAGQRIHKIAKGETFSVLSREHGVSVKAIQDANPNVDSSHLSIGQEIVIPAK